MKIRNGFVSNSSSSSFIILLPSNFDINTVDFEMLVEEYGEGEIDVDQAKEATKQFLKNKEFHEQDGFVNSSRKSIKIYENLQKTTKKIIFIKTNMFI